MDFKKLITQGIVWRGFYFFSLLLVNVFLSRYLQAGATGNVYFLTIIFSFMQVVLTMGMEPGILYFASSGKIARHYLMLITLAWSLIAGVIMVLFVQLYFAFDHQLSDALLKPYSVFGFCFVAGMILMNFSTALFYTKGNYMLPNLLLSVVNLCFVLVIPSKGIPPPATADHWVLYLNFFAYLLSGLLVISAFAYYNRQEHGHERPGADLLRQFFKYAATALAGNIVFFLVYRIDYLFVNASPVCTKEDLGNYIQVSKLGQMMLVLPQIIASVVLPQTASGIQAEKIGRQIMILARLFVQAYIIFLLLMLTAGDVIFIFIFGETFNAMKWPMTCLIPGILAISVLSMLSAYFSGHGRVRVNVQGALLALVVMILGDFIFVPSYGIVAAAIISSISYGTNLAYSIFKFKKIFDVDLKEFVRWRKSDYQWIRTFLQKTN
jgi:O-antigen/teichoic acid export membrane protein